MMSIKVMNRVWEHSEAGGSELLVLLAIADHAHDDGAGAWPAIGTLARKCKLSNRQVTRIIGSLEEAKELGVQRRAGPHGVNMYVVLSGLRKDKTIPKCFMCEAPEGEVQLEKHHTVPGDDASIVLLCRSCHHKITMLERQAKGGDKMSPVADGVSIETSMTGQTGHERHLNHHESPLNRQEEPPTAAPLFDVCPNCGATHRDFHQWYDYDKCPRCGFAPGDELPQAGGEEPPAADSPLAVSFNTLIGDENVPGCSKTSEIGIDLWPADVAALGEEEHRKMVTRL
jgi:hypothetical protein